MQLGGVSISFISPSAVSQATRWIFHLQTQGGCDNCLNRSTLGGPLRDRTGQPPTGMWILHHGYSKQLWCVFVEPLRNIWSQKDRSTNMSSIPRAVWCQYPSWWGWHSHGPCSGKEGGGHHLRGDLPRPALPWEALLPFTPALLAPPLPASSTPQWHLYSKPYRFILL